MRIRRGERHRKQRGADLFEITPVEPYTDEDLNWNDENSRSRNLAEMAGTGEWQEGQRFASRPDEADVATGAQSVAG